MWRSLLVLMLLCGRVTAQSFEEYKKHVQSEFNQYRSNKEREFKEYRDRVNAEFAEYMRQTWPEYKSKPAEPVPDSPEPPAPVIKDPDTPPSNDPIPFDEVKPAPKPVAPPQPVVPLPKPEPQPVKPDTPDTRPVKPNKPVFAFTFYGAKCEIPLENRHRFTLTDATENAVADGWMVLSSDEYLPAAANILLHFVQTAFEYATDDEQFGKERPLFADETLFYPYSDCEDRAILYSVFVRELLGLDVVLLHYPGHLATAVCFDTEVYGDYMTIDGKRYIVCDPTYINADIGQAMPRFKQTPANIIKTN